MDIDIDLKTDFDPKQYFPNAVRASMVHNNQLVKHSAGVYFQVVPEDKLTNFCAIPYDKAEEFNLMKIDFLHLSVLNYFESKEEIRHLIKVDPDWELLRSREVVQKLFQIHNQFDLVDQVQPKNIHELADVLALMRPGKRKLLPAYLNNRKVIRTVLFKKMDATQYSYKKSHAIAYAMTIILQLHLIKAGIM